MILTLPSHPRTTSSLRTLEEADKTVSQDLRLPVKRGVFRWSLSPDPREYIRRPARGRILHLAQRPSAVWGDGRHRRRGRVGIWVGGYVSREYAQRPRRILVQIGEFRHIEGRGRRYWI